MNDREIDYLSEKNIVEQDIFDVLMCLHGQITYLLTDEKRFDRKKDANLINFTLLHEQTLCYR